MNEQAGQFRSAAFGGFHRQDVLDYLEQITQERQALETKLAAESEGRRQAESRLTEAEEQARSARDAQAAMESELEYLRTELEERSAALAQAEEQVKVLRETVEKLQPGAASWEHLREQAGNIELSAHERAHITIQEAQAQAAEIQAEGVRQVLEMQAGCERLQARLHASIRAAEQELDAARDAFARAEEEMDGVQQALSGLLSETAGSIETEDPVEVG